MSKRLEITVSDETWDALNVARGHEPRASFVKRHLERALRVPELDSLGPSPSVELVKAAAAEASMRQRYVEGAVQAVEEPFVVAGPVTRGCPECGGDMRERDPLSRIRVCADCGLTERS